MPTYDEFLRKFNVEELTVHRSTHWTATIRAKQVTLGSTVLLPNRAIVDLDQISPVEAEDLFRVVGILQRAIRETFDADKFNLIAAMMKDPYAHFHLIPRYSKEVHFDGETFNDKDWPALVSFRDVETSDDVRRSLRDRLRDAVA